MMLVVTSGTLVPISRVDIWVVAHTEGSHHIRLSVQIDRLAAAVGTTEAIVSITFIKQRAAPLVARLYAADGLIGRQAQTPGRSLLVASDSPPDIFWQRLFGMVQKQHGSEVGNKAELSITDQNPSYRVRRSGCSQDYVKMAGY